MSHQELGVIRSVDVGLESDHRFHMVEIMFEFDCSGQALQYVARDDQDALNLAAAIADVLGVKRLNDAVDSNAYALRYFDIWNEPICGIQHPSSRRRPHGHEFNAALTQAAGELWGVKIPPDFNRGGYGPTNEIERRLRAITTGKTKTKEPAEDQDP